MKIIQYIAHLHELKPNVHEAFIKEVRLGMYIGLAFTIIIMAILKYFNVITL